MSSLRTPKYRLHKGSGQALVQINGERIYLGKHGTGASKEKYHRIIAEWLASQTDSTTGVCASGTRVSPISVNDLIMAFWKWAEQRYVKRGEPTSEVRSFRTALSPVRRLYGNELVTNFGPLALVAQHGDLNLQKRLQGVFYGDPVHAIDDAWGIAQRQGITPATVGNVDIYVIPRPNSGYAGGFSGQLQNLDTVTIITQQGTNRIITGFPGNGLPLPAP